MPADTCARADANYKARMKTYEMFRVLLRIAGSDAILFGGFVRRMVSGEDLCCDLDIYSPDALGAEQTNMVCSALVMAGWCRSWHVINVRRGYKPNIRRLHMVVDGVRFTVDFSSHPPPVVDFDVSSLQLKDGRLCIRNASINDITNATQLLDVLYAIKNRIATSSLPLDNGPESDSESGDDDDEWPSFNKQISHRLRRHVKLLDAGYAVRDSFDVRKNEAQACPITHDVPRWMVFLGCRHGFDPEAFCTFVALSDKRPACPVCRDAVVY